MTDNDVLLSVSDLRIHFRSDNGLAKAVDGVSFDVGRRETVCIVGESGCGKTVTALSILGLIPIPPGIMAGGSIGFDGIDISSLGEDDLRTIRGNRIGMVFQEPLTSLNPVFTIGDQIGEAILAHEKVPQDEVHTRSVQLLKDVGIPSAESRLQDYPHQLSGGQRQRVMIAMALACHPDMVIADEPTTALDVTVQAQILNLFKELQKKRDMAVLYITHDLGVVANVAERVYIMYAGIGVESGRTAGIFQTPRHPYTQGLLASLPTRSKRGQRLSSIPGSVPNPARKPPGCPFHPRCRYSVETCRTRFPELCDYGDGHLSRCPVLYERRETGGS
ncbi:Oligopeptide ABC transporter, ATP-binding protein OppD (TC 3.A.1.5.1) [Olavius algarvensis associated proteobacterium Delta 3]|nr:Oligopeptide ABC transporter, ATP-binding protein OppD (TC 3.A.1.5.1) [Olavius algarvensis associated proteobacterium Delta 3]CAB5161254.1 Oligopeptide ABC transporter, ATP-binding protein OppD (TC 3.A.1.5.1) [Olavius algarvensis associated proteobacterium Delta 3]